MNELKLSTFLEFSLFSRNFLQFNHKKNCGNKIAICTTDNYFSFLEIYTC